MVDPMARPSRQRRICSALTFSKLTLLSLRLKRIARSHRGVRMSMICTMLGHRRSAKRAKFNFESQQWQSVCMQCRAPMIRVGEGEWQLPAEAPEAKEPELI